MNNQFTWIPFYKEFSNAILSYRADRKRLIKDLEEVFSCCSQQHDKYSYEFPRLEKNKDERIDIDPFSVFSLFNQGGKHLPDKKRITILRAIKTVFKLVAEVPTSFDGIPTVHYKNTVFFRRRDGDKTGKNPRKNTDIDRLWDLYESVLVLRDKEDELSISRFSMAFDNITKDGVTSVSYLTRALFWVAPYTFVSTDEKTLSMFRNNGKFAGALEESSDPVVSGAAYWKFCQDVRKIDSDLPKLSARAHEESGKDKDESAVEDDAPPPQTRDVHTGDVPRHPLNQILFGPPGTGKTYNTIVRAVEIIDGEGSVKNKTYEQIKERFVALKKHGRIDFVTFHQSYGYEDFIDGIKPVCDATYEDDESERSEIGYKRQAGVFRRFCLNAMQKDARLADGRLIPELGSEPRIWKVSLNGTGENKVRTDCLERENRYIRVGFDEVGEFPEKSEVKKGRFVLRALYERMKVGDIVLSCYSHEEIDAIGVVTGKDVRWESSFSECKRVRDVRWVWVAKPHEEKENIVAINQNKRFTLSTVYETKIQLSDVLKIVAKHQSKENTNAEVTINDQRYVFIIDEINRGNISKIFGELITLIEESKRIGNANELRVKLPNAEDGEEDFGVPSNVYIIGTMNTADRSIAMLDTALRRRFEFVEMMPRPDLLRDIRIVDAKGNDTGIDLVCLLKVMNERIEVLLDREHQIGHAYFLEALKERPAIDNLGKLFQNKIIPLLQEYFYDDYEKIRMVLGDGQDKALDFVEKIEMFGDGKKAEKLFPGHGNIEEVIGDERCVYHVKPWDEDRMKNVYLNPLAYQKIYKGENEVKDEEKGVAA